ncbi:hypothetical protein ACIRFH_09165 [Streptomyces sp. NPDC093586]|uniref:Rv1733c family protein n=1 Tax=Streptomyces sp. NPDC093586 TaxID=3366042 RepID=UPI003829B0A5
MRAIRGLWRWRRNPLRRTTDLIEAWVALTGLLLILCVAPLVGALVGGAAQDALQRSVRAQRESRHQVTAFVVRELKRSPLNTDPEGVPAGNLRSRVLARWKAPDGSERRGSVLTALRDPHSGDRFRMWTDGQGRAAARPLDSSTATTHAALAGIGAALATAVLVEASRRIVVWRMVRRRYGRWEREWERAGPDWGRTGTGS